HEDDRAIVVLQKFGGEVKLFSARRSTHFARGRRDGRHAAVVQDELADLFGAAAFQSQHAQTVESHRHSFFLSRESRSYKGWNVGSAEPLTLRSTRRDGAEPCEWKHWLQCVGLPGRSAAHRGNLYRAHAASASA